MRVTSTAKSWLLFCCPLEAGLGARPFTCNRIKKSTFRPNGSKVDLRFMKKTFLWLLAVSGLLAFVPNKSSAQDFGFEVSVRPGYSEGGRCAPRYDEDQPAYYYYRPTYYRRYYYRHYYYRPAYASPYYYQGYYHRGHRCYHEEDED
jgi:hypothetical protein